MARKARAKPEPVDPIDPVEPASFVDRVRDDHGIDAEILRNVHGVRVSFDRGDDRFSRVFNDDADWEARAEVWIAGL